METSPPTWSEIRVICIPTGGAAMIGLAAWAGATPADHLWSVDWFKAAFIVAVAVTLLGLYGFIAHWKMRSIPPVLVALIPPALFLHVSPTITDSLSIVAFLATAYLVSPDRNRLTSAGITTTERKMLREEIKSKDEQLTDALLRLDVANALIENSSLKLSEIEAERDEAVNYLAEIRASQSRCLLRGEVVSFALVNIADMSPDERSELDMQFAIPGTLKYWYVAHLEIEAIGTATRARDWEITANRTDGKAAVLRPFISAWSAPPHWPRATYWRLDEIQSEYLYPDKLYHVIVYIQSTTMGSEMDFSSFEFAVRDSNDNRIVCGFRK